MRNNLLSSIKTLVLAGTFVLTMTVNAGLVTIGFEGFPATMPLGGSHNVLDGSGGFFTLTVQIFGGASVGSSFFDQGGGDFEWGTAADIGGGNTGLTITHSSGNDFEFISYDVRDNNPTAGTSGALTQVNALNGSSILATFDPNPNRPHIQTYTTFAMSGTVLDGVMADSFNILASTTNNGFAGRFYETRIDNVVLSLQEAAVPEPSTYALILTGLLGLGFVRRNRKTAK